MAKWWLISLLGLLLAFLGLSLSRASFELKRPTATLDDPNLAYATLSERARPANVSDGDWLTSWLGNAQKGSKNWLEFRFAEPVTIAKVLVRFTPDRFPRQVTVRAEIIPKIGHDRGQAALSDLRVFRDVRSPAVSLRFKKPVTSARWILFFEEGAQPDSVIEVHEVDWLRPAQLTVTRVGQAFGRLFGQGLLVLAVTAVVHMLFLFAGRPKGAADELSLVYGRGLLVWVVAGLLVLLTATPWPAYLLLIWIGWQFFRWCQGGNLWSLVKNPTLRLLGLVQLLLLLVVAGRLLLQGFFFEADYLLPYQLSRYWLDDPAVAHVPVSELLYGWQLFDRTPLVPILFAGLSAFVGRSFLAFVVLMTALQSLVSLVALALVRQARGNTVSAAIAWLLALSPYFLLSFHLIPVRSLSLFFLGLMVLCLWQTPPDRWLALRAGGFGALAFLSHLVAAPFVLLAGFLLGRGGGAWQRRLTFYNWPLVAMIGWAAVGWLSGLPSRQFLLFFATKAEAEIFTLDRASLVGKFFETPISEILGNRFYNLFSLVLPLSPKFLDQPQFVGTWLIWGALFFSLLPWWLPALKRLWQAERHWLLWLVVAPGLMLALFLGYREPRSLLFIQPAVFFLFILLWRRAQPSVRSFLWLPVLEHLVIFWLPFIVARGLSEGWFKALVN